MKESQGERKAKEASKKKEVGRKERKGQEFSGRKGQGKGKEASG